MRDAVGAVADGLGAFAIAAVAGIHVNNISLFHVILLAIGRGACAPPFVCYVL